MDRPGAFETLNIESVKLLRFDETKPCPWGPDDSTLFTPTVKALRKRQNLALPKRWGLPKTKTTRNETIGNQQSDPSGCGCGIPAPTCRVCYYLLGGIECAMDGPVNGR